MKGNRRWWLAVGALVVLLGGGYGGYRYYQYTQQYITTDDAYVDGQQIVLTAPASGQVKDWIGRVGATFPAGSTVGYIQVQAGNATSLVAVPIPQQATIVQRDVVNGEFVAAGTPLAYAYNLQQLWVTADIKETQIAEVAVGAPVAVHVDAYPQVTLHGHVAQIEPATATTFALIPSRSDTANYTKVTQVLPVKIALDPSPVASLAPGMNASVTIRVQHTPAALAPAADRTPRT